MLKHVLCLAVVTATAVSGFTEIVPLPGTQDVDSIFSKADLVCSCVVTSTKVIEQQRIKRSGRVLTTQHLRATVEIVDLYKPEEMRGPIVVEFQREIPSTLASLPELHEGERAILFLQASPSSAYVFADPYVGVIPFTSLPRGGGKSGPAGLQAALAAVLHLPNLQDQVRAMQLLAGFDSVAPDTIPTLESLSHAADPEVALAAFAVVLKIHAEPGLMRDTLQDLTSYLDSRSVGLDPLALMNISSELRNISALQSIRPMEALSASKYVVIRRGAMQALRAMRSPNAASAVAARLDDTDGYVRYLAVITLAETFGKYGDFAPNMDLFDRNPAFYAGLWKAWWAQEGRNYQPGSEQERQ